MRIRKLAIRVISFDIDCIQQLFRKIRDLFAVGDRFAFLRSLRQFFRHLDIHDLFEFADAASGVVVSVAFVSLPFATALDLAILLFLVKGYL